MVEAAGMGESRSFFADWTIRHPDNPNGELLQHCGPWPISIAKGKAKLTYPLAFSHPGSITAEAKIVEKNQPLLAYIRESLPEAEESMISHMALKEMSKNVKFAIRTGIYTISKYYPYSRSCIPCISNNDRKIQILEVNDESFKYWFHES